MPNSKQWFEIESEKTANYELEKAAEKAGGWAFPSANTIFEADYHEMSIYCRKKGIKPNQITEEEYKMFLFPRQTNSII